jgi:hypothetical protein
MLENLNDSSNSILPLRGPQLSYSNVIANIEAFHQSNPGIRYLLSYSILTIYFYRPKATSLCQVLSG